VKEKQQVKYGTSKLINGVGKTIIVSTIVNKNSVDKKNWKINTR